MTDTNVKKAPYSLFLFVILISIISTNCICDECKAVSLIRIKAGWVLIGILHKSSFIVINEPVNKKSTQQYTIKSLY